MGVDNCKHCDVPENPIFYDIESDFYYTCSDCPCYTCIFLHDCDGQCAEMYETENRPSDR